MEGRRRKRGENHYPAAVVDSTAIATAATRVSMDNGPQIAALVEQVKELKKTVNILISQIQMLRFEVKSKNGSH